MAGTAGIRAGRAFVEIGAKDMLSAPLARAQEKLRAFAAGVQEMGLKFAGIGLAASLPIAAAIKRFVEFDDAMRMTGAVSQATQSQLATLTAEARRLGATTSFTAVEVANLMGELGKAGFASQQITDMTAAVLDLARASGTDAVLAAGYMSATIRQFGLSASDATRVADVLTHTANATFNSVVDLGEALKYAGPVAASLGMSLEETLAVLGGLGNVGIQGEMAGSMLRRLSIIAATEADSLQSLLGVAAADSARNLRPLVDVLADVADAARKLPTAEKTKVFDQLFGKQGITGAAAIGDAAADIRTLAIDLDKAAGVAARTAAEMDAGLGGSFRRLASAIEGIALSIGESLAPALQRISRQAESIAGAFIEWVDANRGLAAALAVSGAAAAGLGAGLVAIGVAAKVAAFGLGPAIVAMKALPTLAISMTSLGRSVSILPSMLLPFRALSGVITGAITPTIALKAAVGGLGAIASFAMSPTGLLSASVVALGYGAFRAAGGVDGIATSVRQLSADAGRSFGAIVTASQQAWSGVSDVAMGSIGNIVNALQRGEFEDAFRLSSLAMQAAWSEVVASFWPMLDESLAQMRTGWDAAIGSMQTSWEMVSEWFTPVIESLLPEFARGAGEIETTWADMVYGLRATLIEWKFWLVSLFDDVGNAIGDRLSARIGNALRLIPGMELLQDAINLAPEGAFFSDPEQDKAFRRRVKEIGNIGVGGPDEDERARRRQAIDEDRRRALRIADEERERDNANAAGRRQAVEDQAKARRDQARQDVAAFVDPAVERAKQLSESQRAGIRNALDAGGEMLDLATEKEQLQKQRDAMADAARKAGSFAGVAGTFSAATASRLGATITGPVDKTAKNTEQMVKEQIRTREAIEGLEMEWAA